jgi:hypothetical protein
MAQVEEKARRTLIWSLTYLVRFQVRQSNAYQAKGDPVKSDRLEMQRRIKNEDKQWGWKKAMEIVKIRLESGKLLHQVLSKSKAKPKDPTPGHDLDAEPIKEMLIELEGCKGIIEMRAVIKKYTDAGKISPEAGQTILDELQEEAAATVSAKHAHDKKKNSLDKLMQASVNEAEAGAAGTEEEPADDADQ